jgi:hypothetical protein
VISEGYSPNRELKAVSGILAWLITLLLIPISNHLIFSGDSGVVIMWLWSALPEALTAAAAAVTAISLIETRRPWPWTGGLIALYLYGGIMTAFRIRPYRPLAYVIIWSA